jgi:heat shock protein HslJ
MVRGNITPRVVVAALALLCLVHLSGCAGWFKGGEKEGVCPVVPDGVWGAFGARVAVKGGSSFMVRLRLSAKGRAEMLTLAEGVAHELVERGTWEYRFGRKVRVVVGQEGPSKTETPLVLAFRFEEDALVLLDADPDLPWARDLRLVRNTAVSGPVWRLLGIGRPDGTRIAPGNPSRYALVLSPDGTATVLADCNRGMGDYVLAGTAIVMRGLAFTRMICGDDSLFDEYTSALGGACSCRRQGDRLVITYDGDRGRLEFEPALD